MIQWWIGCFLDCLEFYIHTKSSFRSLWRTKLYCRTVYMRVSTRCPGLWFVSAKLIIPPWWAGDANNKRQLDLGMMMILLQIRSIYSSSPSFTLTLNLNSSNKGLKSIKYWVIQLVCIWWSFGVILPFLKVIMWTKEAILDFFLAITDEWMNKLI